MYLGIEKNFMHKAKFWTTLPVVLEEGRNEKYWRQNAMEAWIIKRRLISFSTCIKSCLDSNSDTIMFFLLPAVVRLIYRRLVAKTCASSGRCSSRNSFNASSKLSPGVKRPSLRPCTPLARLYVKSVHFYKKEKPILLVKTWSAPSFLIQSTSKNQSDIVRQSIPNFSIVCMYDVSSIKLLKEEERKLKETRELGRRRRPLRRPVYWEVDVNETVQWVLMFHG